MNIGTEPIDRDEGTAAPFGPTHAVAPSTPIPLPEAPALAGVELALQWGVLTSTAPNGFISLSEALRVTLLN